MHPRVSVNSGVLGDGPRAAGADAGAAPFAADIALWRELGAPNITFGHDRLLAPGREEGLDAIRSLGIPVASIVRANVFDLADPTRWDEQRATLRATLEDAHALGAWSVYTTTGSGGGQPWDQAVDAYAQAVAPLVEEAAAMGVRLLVETTNTLNSDISIAHTLPGLLDIADRSGIRLCVDLFHCWHEAHLDRWLVEAAPRADLVQVCDVVIGDKDLLSRAVPGDGHVPIERILRILVDAGFQGIFDMELKGPRIRAEGAHAAAARAAGWLSDTLERIGA